MMKNVANTVEVALGDFGFLETNLRAQESGYEAGLPLGTRHYRSPEQKDYFDVCEVKVSFGENKRTLVLKTSDRKFRDTLIEKGDIAEFSKDSRKIGYTVEKVEHMSEERSKITLQSAGEKESEDNKTQVMFYKKPSPRTDIFGVGAILFDLLTGGKSPECFYDYLRHRDHFEGEQVPTVNQIVEDYRAATNTSSTSPDLASLFEQVRDEVQNRYPSPEIISVLLRCMLSRPSDSYYEKARNKKGEVDRQKLFLTVYEDLANLVDEEAILATMLDSNPIWKGEEFKIETTETTSSILSDIEKTRAMPIGKRMLWGALRFRQLVEMVGRNRNQGAFFYNIRPENLRFNNTGIVPVVSRFGSEEDYLRAVRSGSASRANGGSDTDNYTPIYEKFSERSVDVVVDRVQKNNDKQTTAASQEELREVNEKTIKNNTEKMLNVKVRYTESVPIWRRNRKGDLLRIIDSRGRPQLCEIVEIYSADMVQIMKVKEVTLPNEGSPGTPSGQQIASPSDMNTISDLEKMGRTRGTLCRRLVPMSYYLSIMATYMQHLFFVDGTHDDGAIPDVVWSALLEFNIKKKFPKLDKINHSSSPKTGSFLDIFSVNPSVPERKTVVDVKTLLTRIYLQLLIKAESRHEQDEQAEEKLYVFLLNFADELEDNIAKLYDIHRNELLAMNTTNIEDMKHSDFSSENDEKTFTRYLQDILG